MKRPLTEYAVLTILLLVVLSILGCQKDNENEKPTRGNFTPDSAYFLFGDVYKVEKPQDFSQEDPHHVAQYSTFLCKEGFTNNLIKEIGHVEKDGDLGDAFITFIREFGPDLERFKESSLWLKFAGYKDGANTSVWYYYLVDANGTFLTNKSWISLHRSKYNGKCALTGIFLNLPSEKLSEMPKEIKITK